jgi:hypothetical protein
MSTDHDFVTSFIEMYRSFPCLWKKTDRQYYNRVKRENAYKILLEEYNEYDPNTTQQSVLRKVDSLRCAYTKVPKRIKEL